MTTILPTRFEQALLYATQLHATQIRKGSDIPYVAHLLSVCALVLEHGGGEDEAIAALLHDAIEDQGGNATMREIERQFGPYITALVEACTDARTEPKPPWRARKEAHLAHLRKSPPAALLIIAADKLHNARCLGSDLRQYGERVWDKFNGGRDGTLWYYQAMTDLLQNAELPRATQVLVEELSQTVDTVYRLSGAMG